MKKRIMKLLIAIPTQLRSGAEEYALTVASGAVKQGWDVHAAFPKTQETASLISDFLKNTACYHSLQIDEFENYASETRRRHFLRLVRTGILLLKLKPDVVLITLCWPLRGLGSMLACGLLKVPTVVVFQLAPHRIPLKNRRLKVCSWARRRNQRWVAVSEQNRKILCETFQISEDEVFRIYNGVKGIPSSNNNNPEELTMLRSQLRQELGIPLESRLALTVGRLHPQKGYDDIVPIVPHITKEFPNIKFVWVGEGEYREYLVNKVCDYGVGENILFLGHRPDIPRLLKAVDLFVFPTHFEGLPFSLIEAMAYGVPFISSDASSIPEVIEDHVHGLLFRTGDCCDLLETMRWALKHPDKMQEMAQNALIRVQDFTQEQMVNSTLSVLQQVAHKRA